MLIGSHVSAPSPPLTPLSHGGDLTSARQRFPGAPEPFIDLSTGINPFPYPLPALTSEVFARLPDRSAVRQLAATAAKSYGAPSANHVVPAPGTQILLPVVAALVPPGRAAILQTTYAEHGRAASLAGHAVNIAERVEDLRGADLAVLVNPNNPDGRLLDRDTLLGVADDLRARRGVLVVDESFADVAPSETSIAVDVARPNIVVLRSFGKFYGLAGLRLGFALAPPPLVERIDAALGPWAVAGPAIAIGQKALADDTWKRDTIARLQAAARRLDRTLTSAGLAMAGGTSLYRLTQSDHADALFDRLGRAGILVRRFDEHPNWLRWGLPRDENEWGRLETSLAAGR